MGRCSLDGLSDVLRIGVDEIVVNWSVGTLTRDIGLPGKRMRLSMAKIELLLEDVVDRTRMSTASTVLS